MTHRGPVMGSPVDCVQVDVTRCGGYTEWLRAAASVGGHQLDVSGHCAPYLTAPVAAVTPSLRHLEWFHDHVRIEQLSTELSTRPRATQPGRRRRSRPHAAPTSTTCLVRPLRLSQQARLKNSMGYCDVAATMASRRAATSAYSPA
jgi:hypothetical protein